MQDGASKLHLFVPADLLDRLAAPLRRLDDDGMTLVFAESCTAGLAAVAVSSVPELGHVLEAAFVTYSDEAKVRLLGAPGSLLDEAGAVSEAVAKSMAQGALQRSDADVAIAVTGFAGPAGPSDEEGLVHFAMANSAGSVLHRVEHFGAIGQDAVRLKALGVIFELLEA